MNIVEATKAAMDKGKGIITPQLMRDGSYILPTNTDVGYLVMPIGYSLLEDDNDRPAPRFQPKADDILNTQWEVY